MQGASRKRSKSQDENPQKKKRNQHRRTSEKALPMSTEEKATTQHYVLDARKSSPAKFERVKSILDLKGIRAHFVIGAPTSSDADASFALTLSEQDKAVTKHYLLAACESSPQEFERFHKLNLTLPDGQRVGYMLQPYFEVDDGTVTTIECVGVLVDETSLPITTIEKFVQEHFFKGRKCTYIGKKHRLAENYPTMLQMPNTDDNDEGRQDKGAQEGGESGESGKSGEGKDREECKSAKEKVDTETPTEAKFKLGMTIRLKEVDSKSAGHVEPMLNMPLFAAELGHHIFLHDAVGFFDDVTIGDIVNSALPLIICGATAI